MAPSNGRHSDAISLIQNEMEGLTPRAVPSLSDAKPRCF